MVRGRDVFLPVWSVRCGYETVLMTVLSPQWGLGVSYAVGLASLHWIGTLLNNILCYFDIQFIVPHKHLYGLWFDVDMYSCRSAGSVVDMRRS